MSDFDLQMAADRLAATMFPDSDVQQAKANAVAISRDGSIAVRALHSNLPWYRADVMLPGAVVADTNNVRIAFPQGAMIRHIALSAREAPSGGAFSMRFNATGGGEQRVSLRAGQSTDMVGAVLRVPAGGWLAGSVIAGNDAHDVLITVHYSPV